MADAKSEFQAWMDAQSGYIGKSKKAGWWSNHNTEVSNNDRLDTIMNGGAPNFSVSGSAKENTGRIEGLERAKTLTGQNPYEIGRDYQEAYGDIKKRTQLADTGSELLRANKAGAVAETRQSLQQQGVKGGAAAGAASAVERAKSYDVNNQLQQAQRQAENDYMNAVKSNANFTTANEMNFGAMAAGKDVKAPAQQSNGFGTVICTELHRQGIMSDAIYEADKVYGMHLSNTNYPVLVGYRFLASPIVSLMKKSKLVTKIVASVAMPWANNMAGNPNIIGSLVSDLGEPVCWLVGKLILLGRTLL